MAFAVLQKRSLFRREIYEKEDKITVASFRLRAGTCQILRIDPSLFANHEILHTYSCRAASHQPSAFVTITSMCNLTIYNCSLCKHIICLRVAKYMNIQETRGANSQLSIFFRKSKLPKNAVRKMCNFNKNITTVSLSTQGVSFSLSLYIYRKQWGDQVGCLIRHQGRLGCSKSVVCMFDKIGRAHV